MSLLEYLQILEKPDHSVTCNVDEHVIVQEYCSVSPVYKYLPLSAGIIAPVLCLKLEGESCNINIYEIN